MPEWINSIIRFFKSFYTKDETLDDIQSILLDWYWEEWFYFRYLYEACLGAYETRGACGYHAVANDDG